jgi:hypothetical protein
LWWNGDIIIKTNFVKKMFAIVYGNQNLKVKVKVHPRTGHEDPDGE